MDPIIINEDEVLIIKTDLIIRPDHLKNLRDGYLRQAKEGVIVLPGGFDFAIVKKSFIKDSK